MKQRIVRSARSQSRPISALPVATTQAARLTDNNFQRMQACLHRHYDGRVSRSVSPRAANSSLVQLHVTVGFDFVCRRARCLRPSASNFLERASCAVEWTRTGAEHSNLGRPACVSTARSAQLVFERGSIEYERVLE